MQVNIDWLIHHLLNLAKNTPSEIADVFFNFSPHVRWLSIGIHAFGYHDNKDCVSFTSPSDELESLETLARNVEDYILKITNSPEEIKSEIHSKGLAQLKELADKLGVKLN